MNQEKRILVCEDSMEGIFSAVYDGWKECADGCKVSIQTSFPVNMELFTSYREIATDQSKAGKVMRTILMRLGSEVYEQICLAAASADEDRGTAIYYVLHRAFWGGRCEKRVMEALADPYVSRVAKLALCVKREYTTILGLSVSERLAEDFCWRRSSRGMISCLLWLFIFPIVFPMRTG